MELSRILNSRGDTATGEPLVYCNDDTCMRRHDTLRPESPVELDESGDSILRVGKWTDEEERFALELIRHFLAGALSVSPGVSLRSFLAKKLRCSPMRISTKLAVDTLGGMRIPKRLGQKRFFPMDTVSFSERQRIAQELHELELLFLNKENLEPVSMEPVCIVASSAPISDDEAMSDDSSITPVRIGSWSDEEQTYAAALIDGFLHGMLEQPQGTTLRAFLAERLCCNPMRISKKLATGTMANQPLPKRLGSATFQPARDRSHADVLRTEQELARLRGVCFSPTATAASSQRETPAHDSSAMDHYAPHKPLSPMAPTTKKRCFSETRQLLPSLSQVYKKSRESCAYVLEMQ